MDDRAVAATAATIRVGLGFGTGDRGPVVPAGPWGEHDVDVEFFSCPRGRVGSGEAVLAYGRRAAEYAERLGSMEATAEADRRLIEGWAASVSGRIADVGCGPGHWTAHLQARGHDVEGLDPTPEFVDLARRAHPDVPYRVAGFADLGVHAGYGGVLSWYSLIHLDPDDVPAALARVRAALAPKGRLLLGFCAGRRVESFDHAVATAFFWPAARMVELLEREGFDVDHVEERTDPGSRPHAAIGARRA